MDKLFKIIFSLFIGAIWTGLLLLIPAFISVFASDLPRSFQTIGSQEIEGNVSVQLDGIFFLMVTAGSYFLTSGFAELGVIVGRTFANIQAKLARKMNLFSCCIIIICVVGSLAIGCWFSSQKDLSIGINGVVYNLEFLNKSWFIVGLSMLSLGTLRAWNFPINPIAPFKHI